MDPPASFKLNLRPYQRQALAWLTSQEGAIGSESVRERSIHPLFEECAQSDRAKLSPQVPVSA